MEIQSIPLSQLKPSSHNVRKVVAGVDDLAASIRAHGLRQNLNVERVGDHYEVVAGGRRLVALQQLQKAGELPKDYVVPCMVVEAADSAEASLAENVVRQAMHPADEFEAFHQLAKDGKSSEEISIRFGCTELHVRKRLKLAKVSPNVLKLYRAGKTTLDMVEACALIDDHPKQERSLKSAGQSPHYLRQLLTKGEVEVSDKRVQFVGLAAYEAAGGNVRRDLFDDRSEGYVTNAQLLDKLVGEALEARAEKLRKEGWAWVETGLNVEVYRYNQVGSTADKSKHGAIVTVGYGGRVDIHKGMLKPGQKGSASAKAKSAKPASKPDELSFLQTQILQAERTAVLRGELAGNPRVALAALAARLADQLGILSGQDVDTMVRLSKGNLSSDRLPVNVRSVVDASSVATAWDVVRATWKAAMPKGSSIFEWLLSQPAAVTHQLLAVCSAAALMTVDPYANGRGDAGVKFMALAGVDMAKKWQPSAEWLAKQPTRYLVAAVTEAHGKAAAATLAREKGKAAIARRAAQLLAPIAPGSAVPWLPKPLRIPAAKKAKAVKA